MFVKLFANVSVFNTDTRYWEEAFLPIDFYEKLQKLTGSTIPIEEIRVSSLDGEDVSAMGGVIVEKVSKEDLKNYRFLLNDGSYLLHEIMKGFHNKYSKEEFEEVGLGEFYDQPFRLEVLQQEIRGLQEIEEVTFTIKKKDKDKVKAIMKDFIVSQ